MSSGRMFLLGRGGFLIAALTVALLPGIALAVPGAVQDLAFSGNDDLSWTAVAGAAGHHLYRGNLADLAGGNEGSCLIGSTPGTSATVADNPAVGPGLFLPRHRFRRRRRRHGRQRQRRPAA